MSIPRPKPSVLSAVRQVLEQAKADMRGYVAGATEQLMLQQGQMMSTQEAIIEYLEELATKRRDDVGAEVRIKSIVEQNIARGRAERAEREKAEASKAIAKGLSELALEIKPDATVADVDAAVSTWKTGRPFHEAPADIASEAPVDAAPANPPGSA